MIWRIIVFSIPLGILQVVLLFSPIGMTQEISLIFDILFTAGSYAIVYFVTKSQIQRQGHSWDAVKGDTKINKSELAKLAGLTLIVFTSAYTFLYFILRLIAGSDWFIQLFTELLFYIMAGEEGISLTYLFFTAVIAAPIVEELFFRGVVMNKWAEKYGPVKGVFWSSFIFMIIHIPSFFIPQFLVGVFCAIVLMKTKKLIYAILVHAFYNFLVILPTFLEPSGEGLTDGQLVNEVLNIVNPDPETMRLYTILAVVFVIALIATLYVFKRYGKNMKNEQAPYIHNLEFADDFITFENERALTEEEYLAVWGEKEENKSEKENNDEEEL